MSDDQQEMILKIDAAQTSIFQIRGEPQRAVINGDSTFTRSIHVEGDMAIEGDLFVGGSLSVENGEQLLVLKQDLEAMTLEEILTSKDSRLREFAKIIYDKIQQAS